MVATPEIRSSQLVSRSVNSSVSPEVQASQIVTRTVNNFPTEELRVTQTGVRSVIENQVDIQISQKVVRAVVRGRVDNPEVRPWVYTLDMHDYYVLRCGNQETLVYDTYSKEWSVFGTRDTDLWRAYCGTNWLGGTRNAAEYGSNIIVGDDGNGALYFLDPDKFDDDSHIDGFETQPFVREMTVQYSFNSGYDVVPCYGIQVLGSIGKEASDMTADLSISDDRGVTYTPFDTLTIGASDYDFRLTWQGLGSMRAPGRLFKIKDEGALARVDSVEMNTGD